ncbi:S41A1 protein, partial [Poecile atricapillus]|nr:S41A1 protein [Poecile atricapillus]
MTSKLEQKETPQANGAALPGVPGDSLASPERAQDFLGPDGSAVEVVVLESRANAKGVREEDALLENGSQSNESDDTSTDRGPEPASPLKETSFSIGLQVLFPFLLAGFGTVAAGMVLDIVQVGLVLPWRWALGPGIVECQGLAAGRGGKPDPGANIGQMDTPKELWKMITGNMALIQVQATVVGFLASIAAVVFGWIPDGHFSLAHAVLLCASSVATAFIASLVLGMIMIGVIIGSRKMGINPDNVATPIAASLGDLITLALLSGISWGLYKELGEEQQKAFCVSLSFHPSPVPCLLLGVGGLILDRTVSDPNFAGMAVFTPVINGESCPIPSPACSSCQTATAGQKSSFGVPQVLFPKKNHISGDFFISLFLLSDVNSRSARVLFLLVVPGHLVFLYTIHSMQGGHTTLTLIFIVFYMTAALLQVLILLYIADWMVHWMWGRHLDPDNFSIPYLTALGDLIGTGLLALSFHVLWLIGDRDSDVGD